MEYTGGVVLLIEDKSKLRVLFDRLNDGVYMFEMRFASGKCEMLLQDCNGSKPNLVLAAGGLSEIDGLNYLDSYTPPGGHVE